MMEKQDKNEYYVVFQQKKPHQDFYLLLSQINAQCFLLKQSLLYKNIEEQCALTETIFRWLCSKHKLLPFRAKPLSINTDT